MIGLVKVLIVLRGEGEAKEPETGAAWRGDPPSCCCGGRGFLPTGDPSNKGAVFIMKLIFGRFGGTVGVAGRV